MMEPGIERIVRETLGLDPGVLGVETLEAGIRRRMADRGIANFAAYGVLLADSVDERNALGEALGVNETWFFRYRHSFELLRKIAIDEWRGMNRKLRILSAPCATGEEPYSIAITLLEAGFSPTAFVIDAFDVAESAVAVAEKGEYERRAFRETGVAPPAKYIVERDGRFQVATVVRTTVNMCHGNILDASSLKRTSRYDAVFCRNLLIYFNERARKTTLKTFDRLLRDDGVLFVGHVEGGLLHAGNYSRIDYPQAFAFRKRPNGGAPPVATASFPDGRASEEGTKIEKILSATPPVSVERKTFPVAETRQIRQVFPPDDGVPASRQTVGRKSGDGPIDVAEIRRVADRGDLEAAEAACERLLANDVLNAEANFLMGVIQRARKNDAGEERYLKRCLYLNPNHREALLLLAAATERRGDVTTAKRLRSRAE